MASGWVLQMVFWSGCGHCTQFKNSGELAKLEIFATNAGLQVEKLDIASKLDFAAGKYDPRFSPQLRQVVKFFPCIALIPKASFDAKKVDGIIRYATSPSGEYDQVTNLASSVPIIAWIKDQIQRQPLPAPAVATYTTSQSFFPHDDF